MWILNIPKPNVLFYAYFLHWEKNRKISKLGKNDDFFQKIVNFLDFTRWFLFQDFCWKVYAFLGKWPNRPNFFDICFFGHFTGPVCVERTFFSKKRPKRPPWHITCLIKWLKHQISKNFAVGTLRNVYTKIKPIGTYP